MAPLDGQSSSSSVTVADRLQRIRKHMIHAANRANRSVDDITLVGVTKMVEAARVNELIQAGVTHLGESRIQEASDKRSKLQSAANCTHHLIGSLQTNKARKAVELFDLIQSVDRPRLAEFLNRVAGGMR